MQTNTTPRRWQAIRQDPDTGLRWAMRDYAALVRGIARRILPGHDRDIEECTADVFVALWRNAARLEATGTPVRAWLIVTARNTAINRYRALQRHDTLPLTDELAAPIADLPADPAGDAAGELAGLVAALEPPDREIFLRKYYLMQSSREIAAELAARGIQMLDAPVSGGEPKAIDGTLSFMVGGEEEVFNTFKPVLLAMGSSAVRCGGIGAGNTTKLANQIIVAANIQAVAEALTLAQKAGVDPDLVFQAIKGGLAGSTVMNAKAPMMIEGNDKPGFKVDLHIKDLNNALDCAHTVGAPVPMTAEVQEILQWLHSNGKGQADHSAIAQYYEHLTGIKLGRDL